VPELTRLVSPEIAGNPCSQEKWVRSRLRGLSQALDRQACPTTIARLLRDQKIGLRSHRKVLHKGRQHAERDRQFQYREQLRADFRRTGDPRISIDAKKKELIGNFKNPGQAWTAAATPVNTYDFPQQADGKATPYGVYDPERNRAHVCVTLSRDTPDLAADALEEWYRVQGRAGYPTSKRLLVEADGGGSNSSRSRRFKQRMQQFADAEQLTITLFHYPPGTSKWNPIEHRLFSQITATWAGYVLGTLAILLGFIRRTTNETGLEVTTTHLDKEYPKGVKVSRADYAALNITRSEICPQWNYTIHPRTAPQSTE
jgi:hypothetical protein